LQYISEKPDCFMVDFVKTQLTSIILVINQ